MKRFLIVTALVILSLILIAFIAGRVIHEPRPAGPAGPEAEALAHRMVAAVGGEAWDSTVVIRWTFAGRHSYLWDKKRNWCRISWGQTEVLLDLDRVAGRAWKKGEEVTGRSQERLIRRAWAYFCNDSFWLIAPLKVFDPGVRRELIRLPSGETALLATYTSGGVTPGDSYLWLLDADGRPRAWKMWVSVLPIGGVETTWEQWTPLPTGVRIATVHRMPLYTLEITDLQAAGRLEELGIEEDPFQKLKNRLTD